MLPKLYLFYYDERSSNKYYLLIKMLYFTLMHILSVLLNRTIICCVVYNNDIVASGFISVDRKNSSGYIYGVQVRKDLRGKGLGKLLMMAIIAISKKEGLRKLLLHVDSENVIAINLYKKFGFERTGVMFKMELQL